MAYYIKDPKRDPNFDSHPYRYMEGALRGCGGEMNTSAGEAASGMMRSTEIRGMESGN